MIRRVLAWSSAHPWVVLAAALFVSLVAEAGRRRLNRDVLPELADPQVVLSVDWMGHPASEVAVRVTSVLTKALDPTERSTAVRAVSMAGMAYVEILFPPATDLDAIRARVESRVNEVRARLPPDARTQIGPVAASTGWVFEYALVFEGTMDAAAPPPRDSARARLAAIPGVAEVAAIGDAPRELVVEVRPEELRARGIAFDDVLAALRAALFGGATRNGLLDAPLAVRSASGEAERIGDVATVREANEMPKGMADYADNSSSRPGRGMDMAMVPSMSTVLGGVVIARPNADVPAVIEAVTQVVNDERGRLPTGVRLITTYNRLDLADGILHTLGGVLGEEVAVVALVVLVFLLHWRSAVVVLLTLPLVLLVALAAMWCLRLPLNVMSLGGVAISLGIAVDAEIVALEACHRRLERVQGASPDEQRGAIVSAAGTVVPGVLTSLVITALAFLPVFVFPGETGKLLRPLAVTKTLVIGAAALVALTVGPALRATLLKGRFRSENENPIVRSLVSMYRPFVSWALRRPALTLATGALAVASCIPLLGRLGAEFLPRLDEGDLLFMPTTASGVPPMEAAAQLAAQDRAIGAFREVSTVFGKVGRADTATDPAPFSMAETTIRLRPRSDWRTVTRSRWYSGWAPRWLRSELGVLWPETSPMTSAELVRQLDSAARLPGWSDAWTAPVRARLDMMSTGIRTPLGLRIVAADSRRLDLLGAQAQRVLRRVPGTRAAIAESLGAETWPAFEPDAEAIARFGVNPERLARTISVLVAGGRLDADAGGAPSVRVAPERGDLAFPERIHDVTVRSGHDGSGPPIPLELLGHATYVEQPSMLRTEHGELVSYLPLELDEGTDLREYVERAQREIDTATAAGELALQPGERLGWAGEYRLLEAGERGLARVVPIAAVVMFALLILQFRSVAEAAIVLLSVPFALVGSIWALFLAHCPLSAPVWVGLLATAGLAMQTGVVMVIYIDEAFHRRAREGRMRGPEDIIEAHAEGTVQRLRPKLMTVLTMGATLVPLLWAEGPGAEITRRIAIPMIGGLATSAFLTLEILPVVYTIWRTRQLRRALLDGVPVESLSRG